MPDANFPLYTPAMPPPSAGPTTSHDIWRARADGKNANAGLVFDKFFSGWKSDFSDVRQVTDSDRPKLDWVKRISGAASAADAAEHAARLAAMTVRLEGRVWTATATSRFATGTGISNPLENGFAFHHTLGVPYLAGSGLKGALRAYWTQWHGADLGLMEQLLGRPGRAGIMIVHDMLPVTKAKLVPEILTPHYDGWYQHQETPGDWHDPIPSPYLAVDQGAVFQVCLTPHGPNTLRSEDWSKIDDVLSQMFSLVGVGAKTAIGYGRFGLKSKN